MRSGRKRHPVGSAWSDPHWAAPERSPQPRETFTSSGSTIPGTWVECRIKGQRRRKADLTPVPLILLPHQLHKHSPVLVSSTPTDQEPPTPGPVDFYGKGACRI